MHRERHHSEHGYGSEERSWGPGGPVFEIRRGDFRFLMLTAISEKPMHGYAIIQEVGRTYQRPVSAGLVYPTLQELEDRGYVTSDEEDGKRVYSLTSEGRKYLEDNREIVERLKTGKEYVDRVTRFGFMKELRDMHTMIRMNEEEMDDGKLKRIQEILTDARKKMAAVIYT
jgi:DNA-binding PadR family transcriptional regulator